MGRVKSVTVFVDDMRVHSAVGDLSGRWSHLFSDASTEELDAFAEKIGLKPSWQQNSRGFIHYDVTDNKRAEALRHGATACEWRELTTLLINSYMQENLNLPKLPEDKHYPKFAHENR